MSKYLAEKACEEHKDDMELVILRLFNVYGPNQEKGLIANLTKAMEEDKYFHIYGDGTHTRDFIHIDDVCEAIKTSLESICGTYDVGTGESHSINEVVETYRQIFNGPKFMYVKASDEIDHLVADKTKFIPNWKPRYSLKEGLRTFKQKQSED